MMRLFLECAHMSCWFFQPLFLLKEPWKEPAVCSVFIYPILGLTSSIYPAPGSTLKRIKPGPCPGVIVLWRSIANLQLIQHHGCPGRALEDWDIRLASSWWLPGKCIRKRPGGRTMRLPEWQGLGMRRLFYGSRAPCWSWDIGCKNVPVPVWICYDSHSVPLWGLLKLTWTTHTRRTKAPPH